MFKGVNVIMSSVPQGIYNAICIGVIDMGTQKTIYNSSRKVALLWEIYIDNQVKIFSREYTMSFLENTQLRLHLELWRGGPFGNDELSRFKLQNVLGVPCKLKICKSNKGTKYVESIYRFPKNEKAPKTEAKFIFFDMNDEKTHNDLDYVPSYLIERIKQSPEYTKFITNNGI